MAISVDYLAVAGGGGGGWDVGGGGGAGGLLFSQAQSLNSGTTYTITVGAGGSGSSASAVVGSNGGNSSISGSGFTTVTAIGGGGGGSWAGVNGVSGGSGGGGTSNTTGVAAGTAGQGFAGGAGSGNTGNTNDYSGAAGGGGAGGVGGAGTTSGWSAGSTTYGYGGIGKADTALDSILSQSLTGVLVNSVRYIAGGGGASSDNGTYYGVGGSGGGAAGGNNPAAAPVNTGGGGGGGGTTPNIGSAGGSGVVVVRVLTSAISTSSGGTKTTSGNYTLHTFTSSGTLTLTEAGATPTAVSSTPSIEYLVVAGGGGGGRYGGGGGAGGYLWGTTTNLELNTDYAITVGAGGLGWVGDAQSGGYAASGTDSTIAPATLGTAYSNLFSGTNYLTVASNAAFTFGTGDFTLECWIYQTGTSTSTYRVIFADEVYGGAGSYTLYSYNNALTLWKGGSPQVELIGPVGTIAINTWNHIAWTRSGSSNRLFINGTQVGATATDTTNYISAKPYIGASVAGTFPFAGYISNVRIVKGTAVYTTNFTPSKAPLTAITNTVLLTCNSSTITDTSTNAFVITNTGTVTSITQNPFSYVAVGGGGGGLYGNPAGSPGAAGGSGGGAGNSSTNVTLAGGASLYSQGNTGGQTTLSYASGPSGAGGGGGAGAAGTAGGLAGSGKGGVGLSNSITGTATYYAGGGSGGQASGTLTGGLGGGGTGYGAGITRGADIDATVNTGGGGGGGRDNGIGASGAAPGQRAGNGGSGVVIVRYLSSSAGGGSGGTTTTDGLYTVRTFTSSGTLRLFSSGIPGATISPVISGNLVGVGNVLSCTTGTWTGDGTISYTYQWNRAGTPISGATSSTYTTVLMDGWKGTTCTVTATNSIGSTSAISNSLLVQSQTFTSVDTSVSFGPKTSAIVVAGDQITVAESKDVALTSTASRVFSADFPNLVSSAISVQTTYAYTDGVPITSIGGNTTGGTTGPQNTETWFMG